MILNMILCLVLIHFIQESLVSWPYPRQQDGAGMRRGKDYPSVLGEVLEGIFSTFPPNLCTRIKGS
jgi:hypothetical protein